MTDERMQMIISPCCLEDNASNTFEYHESRPARPLSDLTRWTDWIKRNGDEGRGIIEVASLLKDRLAV